MPKNKQSNPHADRPEKEGSEHQTKTNKPRK